MKKILSYESFIISEELNWSDVKKTAAGVALGAGLALGSPEVVKSQELPSETISQQQQLKDGHSEVIQVPGKSLPAVLDEILSKFQKIRQDKFFGNSLRYDKSGPNKFSGEIQLDIQPKGTRGITLIEFDIIYKAEKYKITVNKIKFIHVGQQPMTPGESFGSKVRPIVGTAASQAVRRAMGGKVGGLGDVLGGVASSTIQGMVMKTPKSKVNFEISGQVPSGMKKKDYDNYLDEVEKSIDYFISLFSASDVVDDF